MAAGTSSARSFSDRIKRKQPPRTKGAKRTRMKNNRYIVIVSLLKLARNGRLAMARTLNGN